LSPPGTRHAPPPIVILSLEREMDSYYKPELSGVSPNRLSPCLLTPRPLAYEAQVVAANPIQQSDYLTNDGQTLLRSPIREVNDEQITGGTSGQYLSELYTSSRLNLASQQDNIADALEARSDAKKQVSRGDGCSAWRPSPGSGAEWDITQLGSMILIVKGGAAWRHTELIDGSPSETAESDYEKQTNPGASGAAWRHTTQTLGGSAQLVGMVTISNFQAMPISTRGVATHQSPSHSEMAGSVHEDPPNLCASGAAWRHTTQTLGGSAKLIGMIIISKIQAIPILPRCIAMQSSPSKALVECIVRAPGTAFGDNGQDGLGLYTLRQGTVFSDENDIRVDPNQWVPR